MSHIIAIYVATITVARKHTELSPDAMKNIRVTNSARIFAHQDYAGEWAQNTHQKYQTLDGKFTADNIVHVHSQVERLSIDAEAAEDYENAYRVLVKQTIEREVWITVDEATNPDDAYDMAEQTAQDPMYDWDGCDVDVISESYDIDCTKIEREDEI